MLSAYVLMSPAFSVSSSDLLHLSLYICLSVTVSHIYTLRTHPLPLSMFVLLYLVSVREERVKG